MAEQTKRLLKQLGAQRIARHYSKLSSTSEDPPIPLFFSSYRMDMKSVHSAISIKSVEIALEKADKIYPTQDDVDALRDAFSSIVHDASSLQLPRSDRCMKYSQYSQLKQKSPESIKPFLTTQLFLSIGGITSDSMSYDVFFAYLDFLARAAFHLSLLRSYDPFRTGIMSDRAFMSYINDSLTSTCYDGQEISLAEISSVISQRILVSTDPMSGGSIEISQLITDPVYLAFVVVDLSSIEAGINQHSTFSYPTIAFMINEYNGLLKNSKHMAEMIKSLDIAEFTSSFVSRMVDYYSNSNYSQFEWFIRFRSSWENLGLRWSNSFFFEAFDVDGDGSISQRDIHFFLHDMEVEVAKVGGSIPDRERVVSELMDMLGTKRGGISREQFASSPRTEFFVRALSDVKFFAAEEMATAGSL